MLLLLQSSGPHGPQQKKYSAPDPLSGFKTRLFRMNSSPKQLLPGSMNFNDFCQRARVNAVVSKQAHYVTLVDGQFKVTTEPQYTDQIRYTAYPERPFPLSNN